MNRVSTSERRTSSATVRSVPPISRNLAMMLVNPPFPSARTRFAAKPFILN